MWYIWLIASGIFFILEIATTGFLVFWLGIGALFAMCTSFITTSVLIQTTIFVISSVILILLTKPLISKYVDVKETIPTNAYRVLGKTGIVIVDIDSINGTGQVKVNGEIWSAFAEENIAKGTEVEVLEISGVKLMVKPKTNIQVNI